MPIEVHNLIDRAAKKAGRSMNAEIVDRLIQSFAGEEENALNHIDAILQAALDAQTAQLIKELRNVAHWGTVGGDEASLAAEEAIDRLQKKTRR